MKKLTYCSYDGRPTIYSPGEAWWFNAGVWMRIDSTEVAQSAPVIGEKAFKQRFPHIPILPKAAFQD